jgi:putative cell wall-binding protein
MASRRTNPPQVSGSSRRPATTPEGREKQLIASAVELAEKQILDGTASSQVLTHFLKLGSSREQLEQEKIRLENELLVTKREAMESAKRVEAMYGEALAAMRSYSGQPPLEMVEDDDDY